MERDYTFYQSRFWKIKSHFKYSQFTSSKSCLITLRAFLVPFLINLSLIKRTMSKFFIIDLFEMHSTLVFLIPEWYGRNYVISCKFTDFLIPKTEICNKLFCLIHTSIATTVGFIRCFAYFSLSLSFHFPCIYKKQQMDGEEGDGGSRVAGERGRVEKRTKGIFSSLFFISFLFESKLNLNSVLTYADLQRNVPYAQKFINQYQRQTLNELNIMWIQGLLETLMLFHKCCWWTSPQKLWNSFCCCNRQRRFNEGD